VTRALAAIAVAIALHDSIANARAQTRTFDVLTATVADIQAAVDAGALTYEQLVRRYLDRIEAYDKRGPTLRAVIAINPRAIDIARRLDVERKAGGRRGPLHGIPIAIKDNIDVIDMPSTGGNAAFAGAYAPRDATVIRRLRNAGAILFIKTNLDEMALGSRGLSSVGGQILNPYDLRRNPGGSSGGTAVSVNVGFAAIGLATETGFSIRSPAANNAIIGIAPTRGLVSRAGVIPISFTQDRVGVHARTVADAALLLHEVRGIDPEDLTTLAQLALTDRVAYVDRLGQPLNGMRLGVLRDLFRQGPEFEAANKLVDKQLAVLEERGAALVPNLSSGRDLIVEMPTMRLNSFELRAAFDAYLAARRPAGPVNTLAELIASGKYLRGGTQETRYSETMRIGALEHNRDYLSRLDRQREIQSALIATMERARVDALVYPVKSLGAPMIGSADDGPRDNSISAVTGLPAVVIPVGFNDEGLPLAIELLGRPFSESRLIALAEAVERALQARVSPKTTPHLPGDRFSY
jgi:Asp-tRNA(Asn)/Glu-tRNA(Gln) amidotransferase A subunit family amidase